MRLYLLKYNNYYNRICKRELSVDGYLNYLIESSNPQTYRNPFECNFNPNDGVSATQVINWDGPVPDYLVCSKNGTDIDSRWFVLEGVRTRGTQFQLTLYRDTIADYYSEIMDSVTYVEKGMITDKTNPLLYNAENMSFNQLKRNTTPIYDPSGCPWIVGFTNGEDVEPITVDVAATDKEFAGMLIANDGIDSFPLTAISGDAGKYALDYTNNSKIWFEFIQTTNATGTSGLFGARSWDYVFVDYSRSPENPNELQTSGRATAVPLNGNSYPVLIDFYLNREIYFKQGLYDVFPQLEEWMQPFSTFLINLLKFRGGDVSYTFKNMLKNTYDIAIDTSYSDYLDKDLIYVKDAQTNKIYKFTKKLIPISDIVDDVLQNNAGDIYVDQFLSTIDAALPSKLYMTDLYGNVLPDFDVSSLGYVVKNPADTQRFPATGRVAARGQGNLVQYILEEVPIGQYSVDISGEVSELEDQPYSMFCMPFSDDFHQIIQGTGTTNNLITKSVALSLANAIQRKLTNSKVYDIQILPFCPVQRALNTQPWGNIIKHIDPDYADSVTPINYTPSGSSTSSTVGYLYWCKKSKFDFEIDFNIKKTTDPIDAKINSMTDFYRLVSPAQGTEYKFDSEKIGQINKFYVQCNYRPFNSSIRVVPEYQPGSLYYSSNLINSQEGLNIMEDMSITQVTDKWAEYELNNKNYRQTFQRSIDNMELQRDIQYQKDALGVLGSTAAGAIAGAKGGWVGAIAGAAVGLGGGIYNTAINQLRANEAIDLTRDNFNYQLGNIKALPLQLSKVSSLGINNSWVPLLEEWSCTDTEKAIAKNKIIYNGMTINAIDNPQNYISGSNCYFKGQLIRIDNIDDEFHVVNTIAGELSKGIYFN